MDIVFALAIVVLVATVIAVPMSICEWAVENHRIPFFVKIYRTWSRKKGEQVVADAKKAY